MNEPAKFNYESLLHDDANLALNLRQYVMGFSPNVREVFAAFNFDDAIRDLERAGLLYLPMERFNEKSKVDLRPASLSNHEMGYVFEHLLRKFNEALNQNPGEHFTPREVIRLMVDSVLMFDTDLASGEGVARTVNDCCCGTGGMLSNAKDRIQQINPQAMQNNSSVRQRPGQHSLKAETLPPLLPSSFSPFTFQRGQLCASLQILACPRIHRLNIFRRFAANHGNVAPKATN